MHRPEDTGRRHRRGDREETRRSPRRDLGRALPPPEDDEPMYIFTAAQSRELDRLCVSEFAIPSIVLMENAALGIASVARDQIKGVEDPCVLIFCGPGNNGGDGLATARHLANDGTAVSIVISARPEKYSGDAKTNLEIAARMGIPIVCAEPLAREAARKARAELGDPDLVIDALLGTGIDRPASGIVGELIQTINAYRAEGVPILSVDVPSGLDADAGGPAGGPEGQVVTADVTVALLGLKPGYLTLAAQPFLGDCLVAGIGAPRALIERLGRPLDDRAGREGRGEGPGRSGKPSS
jgi:NAD(P)H-hydrate epimerase